MSLNNIDEVIKKAYQESERQNDHIGNLSKDRVWNAIVKPKKQKLGHWGFVTAMAASVSLFLVSVFLFYNLDLKQKELEALKTSNVPIEFPAESPYTGIGETGPDKRDFQSEEVGGPLQTREKEQITPLDLEPNLAVNAGANAHNRQLIPLPMIEKLEMDIETEITIPEFDSIELKEELVLAEPSNYEIPTETKSEKPGKLKIRFGSGSPSHSHHPSLSLNLKL